MGTSKSSSGSPSNVPMVPPWVPDPDVDEPDNTPEDSDQSEPDNEESDRDDSKEQDKVEKLDSPIAPRGRFGGTRTSLGDFGSSGDRDSLRRGVGRYVSGGLGGSGTAVRRFGGTASTANSLYGALGGASSGQSTAVDRALLAGKSAREIIDTVIEAVCPVDGTQDTESSRNSINDALTELLQRHPDADILDLSEDQREFVVESYVSMDVYRRFVLDVGNAIRDKAPNASTALSRLKQAREYIREHIVASFRKLREAGTRLSGSRVSRVVARSLKEAFDVFSGYAE